MMPTLSYLESLARMSGDILRAGFNLRPGFGNPIQIDFKGEIDLVTEIDRRSEALLIGEIRSRFPEHSIVAEESGNLQGSADHCWYIDPLDGTINYAHGLPSFTVSVAYAENAQVILGVVYDPIRDECFTAQRGTGAFLNGEPIRVSNIETLGRSLLVTGFPYDIRTNPENNLDLYARFSLLSQGVRRLGSAAQDLCFVAAGRLDGFWELSIYPWDIVAGSLIAEEAGARVTKSNGEPDCLSPPYSILAANPILHPKMLEVLLGS
jgi:myo-inositol-1(or 4)-monophosphatase